MPGRVYAISMTLQDVQGDLFKSSAPAIGHGVNVDSLFGPGVAALVRSKFPEVYEEYGEAIRESDLKPGQVQAVLAFREDGRPVYVLNMATQDRPGPYARVEWIESATRDAMQFCYESGYSRLAIPRLGCGIGGLSYEKDVRPVFEKVAAEFPGVTLAVYFL